MKDGGGRETRALSRREFLKGMLATEAGVGLSCALGMALTEVLLCATLFVGIASVGRRRLDGCGTRLGTPL